MLSSIMPFFQAGGYRSNVVSNNEKNKPSREQKKL